MTGINMVESMRVFRKVVDTGSFTRASKELRLSVAWTAKHVERLEDALGATLLIRSTRQLRITEAGQACYDSAGRLMDELFELKEQLGNEAPTPSGKLRISVPQILALHGMGEIVGNFSKLYPDIKFDIIVNDRFVDVLGDRFDFAFRVATDLKDSQLLTRSLGKVQRVLCASPEYLEQQGTPSSLEELLQHQCIVYSWLTEPDIWTFLQAGHEVKIRPNIHMSVNNSLLIKPILIAGGGIGILPEYVIRAELETGQLIQVLPDIECEAFTLYLVRAADRFQPARARLFSDFVGNALAVAQLPS